MGISLIISTYNKKDELYLCLLSVKRQTRIPDEVVIADDGSTKDTAEMISKMNVNFPCPIKYVWQEDRGFRKSLILNKVFACCEGDYIIQIDGDIIMNRSFIKDHESVAHKGYFFSGSRGKISSERTKVMLQTQKCNINFFSKGLTRRINTLRLPFLSFLFYRLQGLRGCNMAFWKKDILQINGYDESIIGFGYEDNDLSTRLVRANVKRRFLKFKAIEYHLFHNHDDNITGDADQFRAIPKEQRKWCNSGKEGNKSIHVIKKYESTVFSHNKINSQPIFAIVNLWAMTFRDRTQKSQYFRLFVKNQINEKQFASQTW